MPQDEQRESLCTPYTPQKSMRVSQFICEISCPCCQCTVGTISTPQISQPHYQTITITSSTYITFNGIPKDAEKLIHTSFRAQCTKSGLLLTNRRVMLKGMVRRGAGLTGRHHRLYGRQGGALDRAEQRPIASLGRNP